MKPVALALLLALAPSVSTAEDGDDRAFRSCRGCHAVGEGASHGVGPQLNSILGREAGTAEGFGYSDAMSGSGVVWTEEALDAYIAKPREFMPGTSMAYNGLRREEDRAAVIAYLAGFSEAEASEGFSPEVEAILAIDGDPAYGEYLASECTGCHSENADAGIPKITGMSPGALTSGLVAYRSGEREHQVMQMLAGRLGDAEIAALAAYFSTIEP